MRKSNWLILFLMSSLVVSLGLKPAEASDLTTADIINGAVRAKRIILYKKKVSQSEGNLAFFSKEEKGYKVFLKTRPKTFKLWDLSQLDAPQPSQSEKHLVKILEAINRSEDNWEIVISKTGAKEFKNALRRQDSNHFEESNVTFIFLEESKKNAKTASQIRRVYGSDVNIQF